MIVTFNTVAQTDSAMTLPEVIVSAYPSKPLLLNSATSVSFIQHEQISDYASQSLVPVMNAIAGVRMEERSPGSYRLSIRGSLLRSPFGIRNIKIYLGEFPLTDAGGNTYLNLIDANSIASIQILKGPEGSVFGANTGGVIFIDPENKTDSSFINGTVKTGSFGLFNEQVCLDKKWNNYSLNVNQSYVKSDGYRKNSALQRNYIQALQKLDYANGNLKLFLAGSKLHYETPGGLTLEQMVHDPRQARSASAVLPGAAEQRAGIYNNTVYGGASNTFYVASVLKHVIVLFGSYSDFRNPFITNYETRKEKTTGLRSYLEVEKKNERVNWKWNIGMEWQQTASDVVNYDNHLGNKGDMQAADNLQVSQGFIFSQFSMLINSRITVEAGISYNNYQFNYKNVFPLAEENRTTRKLDPKMMPRTGVSYHIVQNFVWRASVSKGFSPPTLAELRPSDNLIHGGLQSEYGWNYETGFRFKSRNARWDADLVAFRFILQDAILRNVNDAGAEYFINAGSTNQMGLEFQLFGALMKHTTTGFMRGLDFRNGFTCYNFRFTNYSNTLHSFTGNKLTGVPASVNTSSLKVFFPNHIQLFLSYNYTDKIPLNDANTVYAPSYQLMGVKMSWEYAYKQYIRFQVFTGFDVSLTGSYSLGNDLNAVGNRYYNPAPPEVYYAGLQIKF